MKEAIFNTVADAHAPSRWYAIQTRSRHEKAVAARLQAQSLQAFLPLHRSTRTWKNGVHADVHMPLFPCYLFVRSTVYDRLRILQVPGVLGFAASTAAPTAIPDAEMDALKIIAEKFEPEPHPYLNEGDRIRIITGPLAGMQGILTRRKQEYRVVLTIEAIMRSIAVEVSEFDIASLESDGASVRSRKNGALFC
jgi:transcription antitermination factor NusG